MENIQLKSKPTEVLYHGESICTGKKASGVACTNKAYYLDRGCALCGVHSSKTTRKNLPKNPNKDEIANQKIFEHMKGVALKARENLALGKGGSVTVSKMRMMKAPEDIEGFLKVYPNYKHQSRKDGFGCASLSPKSLGSVDHRMKGVPKATSIENFHQFSKIYSFELDSEGKVSNEAKKYRNSGFSSHVPQRHKYTSKELKEYSGEKGKERVLPLYSLFYDEEGRERKYSYLECRYFYCVWYEILVLQIEESRKDLSKLREYLKTGCNLQIIGYDGYTPSGTDKESIYRHYKDTSRPFGHEMVLFALLVLDNPEEYPWRMYRRERRLRGDDPYEGVMSHAFDGKW